MNHFFCKTFLSGAALAALLISAAGGETLTVNAVKNAKTDWDSAQKIFTENSPAVVFQLRDLSKKEVSRAFALPDTDRSQFGVVKSAVQDEYHYTLDSAAEQAAKEQEKDKEGDTEEKAAPNVQTFGNSAFYVAASGGSLTFMFKNSTKSNGVYEIILEPMDQANFGRQGLHLLYHQGSGTIQSLNWVPRERGNPRILYRSESCPTDDSGRITAIGVSWQAFYTLTGDIPVRQKSSVWKLGVYRWLNGEGQSLGGIPHESANTYLVLPPISAKDIDSIKRSALELAINGFFYVDQKKGNYTAGRLSYIISQRRQLAFWKERFGVIYRLGFPLTFSEYYMPGMKRIVPKDEIGLEADAAKKEDEPGWRIREFQENMELLGNFIKGNDGNSMLIDAMIRRDLGKFAYPETDLDMLRKEAISDRIFGPLFLEEE